MSRPQGGDTPLTDAHCGIREGDDPENFLCTVKFARDLERQLAEAVRLLRAGKRQFAPYTTNSEVDDFLSRFKEGER